MIPSLDQPGHPTTRRLHDPSPDHEVPGPKLPEERLGAHYYAVAIWLSCAIVAPSPRFCFLGQESLNQGDTGSKSDAPQRPTTMKPKLLGFFALTLLAAFSPQVATLHAQGTTFTYQGRLDEDGTPANGVYDLRFQVFDALTDGLSFGANIVQGVGVTNGLFTVQLAYSPAAFDGGARWLEIGARTNAGGTFTQLAPRQPVTATPYALVAGSVTGAIPLAQLPAAVV